MVGLLATWEVAGRLTGADQVSSPSRIIQTIMIWLGGELYPHLFTTLSELACGMAIGCSLGILAGLLLGRMPIVSIILRPIIVGLYSVPLVTLAPLFIMFFGLGLLPKIVLVSIVTFFLLFFNTFTGAQQVDVDYLRTLDLMGATKFEQFRKVVAPATAVWTSPSQASDNCSETWVTVRPRRPAAVGSTSHVVSGFPRCVPTMSTNDSSRGNMQKPLISV